MVEQNCEAIHLSSAQRLHRFGRYVAVGETSASSGNDHVQVRVVGPATNLMTDSLDVVDDDGFAGELVTGSSQPFDQQSARAVACFVASVRDRQNGDP